MKTGNNAFLQGDAVRCLRGMDVPRAVLEQAAAIAEADQGLYVQSRGEILRNYIGSMPAEDTARPGAVDPRRRRRNQHLDKRGVGVSAEALREAAGRADADVVKALLDAGVAPTRAPGRLADAALLRDAQACQPRARDRLAGADGAPARHRRRRRLEDRRQQEHAADQRRRRTAAPGRR